VSQSKRQFRYFQKMSMLEDSGESPSRRVATLEEKIRELLGKFEQFSVTEEHRSCREILRPLNEADPAPLPSEDIQGEFQALRDSFQHMKLPARLQLNADQQHFEYCS
jgi:hypothetical protein